MYACTLVEPLSFETLTDDLFFLHRLQKTQFERMCDPQFHTKLGSQEVQAIFYIFRIGLNVWQLLNCIWA